MGCTSVARASVFNFTKSVTAGIRARLRQDNAAFEITKISIDDGSKKKGRRSGSLEHASLEIRVGGLKVHMANGETKLEELGGRQLELSENMDELEGAVELSWERYKEELALNEESLQREIEELKATNEELQTKIDVLEKAVANVGSGRREVPRLRVPETKPFNGTRDAKVLENFIWQVEQYFKTSKMEDKGEKMSTGVMYLTDDAMLWWRQRYKDIEMGLCTVDKWEDLKELKFRFLPDNVEYLARKSPMRFKHSSSIRDYMKQFTMLMLDITDMTEKDRLFFFMNELQKWGEQKLTRQGVKDLASAVAAAERHMEFNDRASESSKLKQAKDLNKSKGGGERKDTTKNPKNPSKGNEIS